MNHLDKKVMRVGNKLYDVSTIDSFDLDIFKPYHFAIHAPRSKRFNHNLPPEIDVFSVGAHCMACSKYAKIKGLGLTAQLTMMVHDAGEIIIGDPPGPPKDLFMDRSKLELLDRKVETYYNLPNGIISSKLRNHIDKASERAELKYIMYQEGEISIEDFNKNEALMLNLLIQYKNISIEEFQKYLESLHSEYLNSHEDSKQS